MAGGKPDAVALDYAYYNPVSLLLKKEGWLEEGLARDSIGVRWVLSLGSNKALEYLRGSSIDFGSTAGSAVLVARAGGLPVKAFMKLVCFRVVLGFGRPSFYSKQAVRIFLTYAAFPIFHFRQET